MDKITELNEQIERLQDSLDHLRKCKEFESNLQTEIINVGAKYVNIKAGKTYSVSDAWTAIKRELEKNDTPKLT